MDIPAVKASWDDLTGRRVQFVETFYQRLFERYPHYRELFPEQLDPQHEKMTEMITMLARLADHMDLLQPYLASVGFAHRRTGIHDADVENFKAVFMDTLAELLAGDWDQTREAAWREVFDDVIIPMFNEGLERGRSATA